MAGVRKLRGKNSPWAVGPWDVSFTIGAETTSRNVALQFHGNDGAIVVQAYLSNDEDGDSILTTAPTGTVVIGTDGVILADLVAKKAFLLKTDVDGKVDLTITESGAKDMYLAVVMADGSLVVSPIISFAG